MIDSEHKARLEEATERWNHKSFIVADPISIPHRYTKLQDIEISGLFAAILAWGQRKTIIRNANRIMELMDHAPHEFVLNHHDKELIPMQSFVHRTFNGTDLLYFISFLKHWYQNHNSLEQLFMSNGEGHIGEGLIRFHRSFFDLEWAPKRTQKHIASPERNSACKRLNMYLRWMVRKDESGVDFGVWKQIGMHQLICPLDVHVARTARKIGLLQRKQDDWKAAIELTNALKELNSSDPVRYDYGLFGLSLEEV